ncbi:MAG: 50S ribosomal protein L5 [Candidatus Aureabacteria bacterium]|nr:50S ribosomal protein L5 [Candidatus Auribacterota bacterium]
MSRLYIKYVKEVRNELKNKFQYKNIMQVPRLEKVILNMGVGRATQDKSLLEEAVMHLTLIAGQKPVICSARKAIAGFKLKEYQSIGCKVTLRGKRMYEFMDRLFSIVIPLMRDFRGMPKKLDGRGNYTLGWPDITLFPEINLDSVKNNYGMDISFITTAKSDEEGYALLEALGMPFRKN